jgi:hypothetical protein
MVLNLTAKTAIHHTPNGIDNGAAQDFACFPGHSPYNAPLAAVSMQRWFIVS